MFRALPMAACKKDVPFIPQSGFSSFRAANFKLVKKREVDEKVMKVLLNSSETVIGKVSGNCVITGEHDHV